MIFFSGISRRRVEHDCFGQMTSSVTPNGFCWCQNASHPWERGSTSTFTRSYTRQSPFLAYGCFCFGDLIHYKPSHHANPATSAGENRTAITPRTSSPTLLEKCVVASLINVPHVTYKHGGYLYSPYPRRLESLIICR